MSDQSSHPSRAPDRAPPRDRRFAPAGLVPKVASAAVVLIGCLVLLGWTLDTPVLISLVPHLTPMNPATALAFLLAGVSLWLSAPAARPAGMRASARLCALVVVLLSLARLGGYLFGGEVAVDQLLFRERLDAAPHGPNRMAPNTAFNFLLTGLALLLLDVETRRGWCPAQYFALGTGVVSLLALTGYAYSEMALIRIAAFIPMALNTALAFAALCLGILWTRPRDGLMRSVTSTGPGGVTVRRLLPAAIGLPWLLGWLCLWGQHAGLYGTEFGAALFAVATTVVLVGIIWWNARSLDRSDAERGRVEAALAACAAEFQDLYDSAPCGYHSLDEKGTFARINATELAWLGYSRDEVLGKMSFTDLLTPDGIRLFAEQFPRFKEEGRLREVEFELVRKDGSRLPVLVSATAIRDPAGGFVSSRSVVFDITERKHAEREVARLHAELTRHAAALEDANKELEAFSYSVSHDLRAPLRAVDGFARILLDEHAAALDAEGCRVLDVVCQNARQMGRLIDDLLALSRLGRKELDKTPVDMRALAAAVVAEVEQLEPDRSVVVTIHPLPAAFGDRGMLHQVLANLVGNAFKYTRNRPGAQIEIAGKTTGMEMTYVVRDNGAGFEMAYANKLFGVFQRLHRAEEFEGTGVGLAIVQRIVKRHGGRVWAEGAVDRGATFYFTLPAVRGVWHGVQGSGDPPGRGQPSGRGARTAGASQAEPS